MYGFVFGADNTGCAVGNPFVVYPRAVCMWERCTKTIGLVVLVHYEADEIVFPPFLFKLDEIEEIR